MWVEVFFFWLRVQLNANGHMTTLHSLRRCLQAGAA